MLNGNDILQVNPGVVIQETGDELVVVIPDQGKYVVVNQTGARILQMSDGKMTLADIAAAISAACGLNMEQIVKDVIVFSGDLVSRGILRIAEVDMD